LWSGELHGAVRPRLWPGVLVAVLLLQVLEESMSNAQQLLRWNRRDIRDGSRELVAMALHIREWDLPGHWLRLCRMCLEAWTEGDDLAIEPDSTL